MHSRPRLIERLRRRLERDGWPRLQMLLIVAITGGAGFLASSIMLGLGLVSMPVRYFLACAVAYAVFLVLLWIWLRTRTEDWLEEADLSDEDGNRSARRSPDADDPAADDADGSGLLGDSLSAAAEAEELAIPVIVLVVLAAIVLSSIFVIWSAPVLLAELLVDGVLMAGLYRRLRRRTDPAHWLETAIRRTAWPFLVTALVATAAGWITQTYRPQATTVGDATGMAIPSALHEGLPRHGAGSPHDGFQAPAIRVQASCAR